MDWSEETNPQLLSIVLVGEYSQRFGHSMPREVMESNMSTEALNKQMEEALAAGKPIQAWAEKHDPLQPYAWPRSSRSDRGDGARQHSSAGRERPRRRSRPGHIRASPYS